LVKDMIRVETDNPGEAVEGKSIIQNSGPKKSNFFTFQKGVGSENIDPSQLPPEMQNAIAQATAQADAITKPAKAEAAAEAAAQAPGTQSVSIGGPAPENARAQSLAQANKPKIEPGSGDLNAGFVNIENQTGKEVNNE
jgi:hypothetical protein